MSGRKRRATRDEGENTKEGRGVQGLQNGRRRIAQCGWQFWGDVVGSRVEQKLPPALLKPKGEGHTRCIALFEQLTIAGRAASRPAHLSADPRRAPPEKKKNRVGRMHRHDGVLWVTGNLKMRLCLYGARGRGPHTNASHAQLFPHVSTREHLSRANHVFATEIFPVSRYFVYLIHDAIEDGDVSLAVECLGPVVVCDNVVISFLRGCIGRCVQGVRNEQKSRSGKI